MAALWAADRHVHNTSIRLENSVGDMRRCRRCRHLFLASGGWRVAQYCAGCWDGTKPSSRALRKKSRR
jgi:hypothetical protein